MQIKPSKLPYQVQPLSAQCNQWSDYVLYCSVDGSFVIYNQGIGEIEVSSSSSSEDFTFSTSPNKDGKLKVNVQTHPTPSMERSFHDMKLFL